MAKGSLAMTMRKAQELFKSSGMSLDELGHAMGYKGEIARKAAWQFLNKTSDPRLSMLDRFAKAVKANLKDLV